MNHTTETKCGLFGKIIKFHEIHAILTEADLDRVAKAGKTF